MSFTVPDWFGEILVGSLAAVLGYLAKWYLDYRKSLKKERQREKEELNGLQDLLDESLSIFRSQNYQARRLMALLRSRLGDRVPRQLGFNDTFVVLHAEMVQDERELHSLIRSTTTNSMRRVNEEFGSWLRRNPHFKRGTTSEARSGLAEQLLALELHINQWHDKFAVVKADDRMCLVYLADEKKHGTGFPSELSRRVEEVLAEYRG